MHVYRCAIIDANWWYCHRCMYMCMYDDLNIQTKLLFIRKYFYKNLVILIPCVNSSKMVLKCDI